MKTHLYALQHHWLYFTVGCGRSETSSSCSKAWLLYHLLKQVLSTADSSVAVAAATKCLVPVMYLSSWPPFCVHAFAMISEDPRLNAGCKAGLLVTYFYRQSLGVRSNRYIPVAFHLPVWHGTGRESILQISKCLDLWARLDDKMLTFKQRN